MDYLKEIKKCQGALVVCEYVVEHMPERKIKKIIKLSKKIGRLCQKEIKQWHD
jgi:hypothetical protein